MPDRVNWGSTSEEAHPLSVRNAAWRTSALRLLASLGQDLLKASLRSPDARLKLGVRVLPQIHEQRVVTGRVLQVTCGVVGAGQAGVDLVDDRGIVVQRGELGLCQIPLVYRNYRIGLAGRFIERAKKASGALIVK